MTGLSVSGVYVSAICPSMALNCVSGAYVSGFFSGL